MDIIMRMRKFSGEQYLRNVLGHDWVAASGKT